MAAVQFSGGKCHGAAEAKLKSEKRDASEELESIQKLLHDAELQLDQALRQLNQVKLEKRENADILKKQRHRYQQGHRENHRATSSEAFQRLRDGALRSGFRFILAETAERKTESFLFRRRRRNNPKKREVKGFEGWRFPQGNTTPYLDFSLAWYALPIERLFVPEVALRVGACGA